MTTSEILKIWRGDRKKKDMAAILGVVPGFYSDLENGKKQPGKQLILKLVGLTGHPAEVFLRQKVS
jgi:transcriptional regulator with XRE-family HTH domain